MNEPEYDERQKLSSRTHYRSEEKARRADRLFVFKDSGHIERRGYVPHWLALVSIGLVIWAIYYLWAYWQPPPM